VQEKGKVATARFCQSPHESTQRDGFWVGGCESPGAPRRRRWEENLLVSERAGERVVTGLELVVTLMVSGWTKGKFRW